MAAKQPIMQVYLDHANAWRWRLRARNGRVIATAGESFSSHYAAERAAEAVLEAASQVDSVTTWSDTSV